MYIDWAILILARLTVSDMEGYYIGYDKYNITRGYTGIYRSLLFLYESLKTARRLCPDDVIMKYNRRKEAKVNCPCSRYLTHLYNDTHIYSCNWKHPTVTGWWSDNDFTICCIEEKVPHTLFLIIIKNYNNLNFVAMPACIVVYYAWKDVLPGEPGTGKCTLCSADKISLLSERWHMNCGNHFGMSHWIELSLLCPCGRAIFHYLWFQVNAQEAWPVIRTCLQWHGTMDSIKHI